MAQISARADRRGLRRRGRDAGRRGRRLVEPGPRRPRAPERSDDAARAAALAGPRRRARAGARPQPADPARQRPQPGRAAVQHRRHVGGDARAGARLPDQRRLLRGRQRERGRHPRGCAGDAQPGPPPGFPVERLRSRLPGLDPLDRLPVHLHLRRLAASPAECRQLGARPADRRGRAQRLRLSRRSAGRPTTMPITCCLTGRRRSPRTPSSARTCSTAGAAAGDVRAAFTQRYARQEPDSGSLRAVSLAALAARQAHAGRRESRSRRSPAPR